MIPFTLELLDEPTVGWCHASFADDCGGAPRHVRLTNSDGEIVDVCGACAAHAIAAEVAAVTAPLNSDATRHLLTRALAQVIA